MDGQGRQRRSISQQIHSTSSVRQNGVKTISGLLSAGQYTLRAPSWRFAQAEWAREAGIFALLRVPPYFAKMTPSSQPWHLHKDSRMAPLRLLAVVVVTAIALSPADAAKVKVWQQHTQGHYDRAKFKDAVVTSEGALRLSRQVKPFANVEAANIWDLAEDKAGNLYVATGGDEGKIYKVTPDGKSSVIYTSKDSHIFCLAITPAGTVYAGTGPTGKLVRITNDGKATIAADDLDSYIWSLAIDADSQSVYAGTGPKGKIYRVPAGGKAEIFYATKQEHILCLAMGEKGNLYAGTDKGGLIYRISPARKGVVLYHANHPDGRSLLVTPDAVFAGTSAPIARKGSAAGGMKFDDSRGPAPGENPLYRIAADGSVRELYRDKTMILRIAQH